MVCRQAWATSVPFFTKCSRKKRTWSSWSWKSRGVSTADITGTNILVEEGGTRVFRFQPGPIFANLTAATAGLTNIQRADQRANMANNYARSIYGSGREVTY